MINKSLDLDKLKETFNKDKSVIIQNFLELEEAARIYNFLAHDMPEDWWFTSINDSGEADYKGAEFIRRFKENLYQISEKHEKVTKAFVKGHFSYIFDRTMDNHHTSCECRECKFREFLKTEALLGFVKEITGAEVKHSNEVFCSRFTSGQFLSPHHDVNKGKIGFVYSISKDWKPEYGGNLYILDEDYKTIKKVVLSTFNRLVLFDIPSRDGVPHFVSHVAPGVANKRISITGWFH